MHAAQALIDIPTWTLYSHHLRLIKGSLHTCIEIQALTIAKFIYPHSRHTHITILINVDNLWS